MSAESSDDIKRKKLNDEKDPKPDKTLKKKVPRFKALTVPKRD